MPTSTYGSPAAELVDTLPNGLQSRISWRAYELHQSPRENACESYRDQLVLWTQEERQDSAAQTMPRDWDDIVPLSTSSLEHRAPSARRTVQRLGRSWRALGGGPNLIHVVA